MAHVIINNTYEYFTRGQHFFRYHIGYSVSKPFLWLQNISRVLGLFFKIMRRSDINTPLVQESAIPNICPQPSRETKPSFNNADVYKLRTYHYITTRIWKAYFSTLICSLEFWNTNTNMSSPTIHPYIWMYCWGSVSFFFVFFHFLFLFIYYYFFFIFYLF